jgi:light-regulated signal transduction histidine kinase (bacteriophytochrome)
MKFDYSDCAKEQIHLLGGIQDGGYLLGFSTQERAVAFASQNFFRVSGRAFAALRGLPLQSLLEKSSCEAALQALEQKKFGYENALSLRIFDFSNRAIPLRGVLNECSADFFLLELSDEIAPRPETSDFERFRLAGSVDDLMQAACDAVFDVSGYDRVMAYLFDSEYNGTVAAQTVKRDVASYLNHHFPAHDIPQQARELYLKNWIRVIEDSGADPTPIEGTVPPSKIDLSNSAFRAVSPIHLEYLRNMGVASSMSIALLYGGRLFGLITGHSILAKKVSLASRAKCLALIKEVNSRLAALKEAERENKFILFDLAQASARAGSFGNLLGFFGADALAFAGSGPLALAGLADGSTEEEKKWLLALMAELEPNPFFSAEDHGNGKYPGVLFVRLQSGERMLLLRKERVEKILWGGNPYDPNFIPYRGGRIEPRKSFQTFEQVVKGRSVAWSAEDLEFAKRMASAATA